LGEPPGPGLARIRERSAFGAEHLGLHERLGDLRAGDVLEGPPSAGPLGMESAGDHALASPRLPEQEDGRQAACGGVTADELLQLVTEPNEGRAFSEQLGEARHEAGMIPAWLHQWCEFHQWCTTDRAAAGRVPPSLRKPIVTYRRPPTLR